MSGFLIPLHVNIGLLSDHEVKCLKNKMTSIEIFLIAISLAMDAFAASIVLGMNIHRYQTHRGNHCWKREVRQWVLVAVCFCFFQAIMPVIGWSLGLLAIDLIEPIDHWVAFILLASIGGHMLWEARKTEEIEEEEVFNDPMTARILITLGIATSIDAFAVGVSLVALKVSIWYSVIVIGLVTAVLSAIGTWIGDRIGHLFERKLEMIGGIILIFLGFKILFSHLTIA